MGKTSDTCAGTCVCCLFVLAIIYFENQSTVGLAEGLIVIAVISVIVYLVWRDNNKKKTPQSQSPPFASYSPSQSATIKRINCSKCGFENTEDQTYCGRCGYSLANFTPYAPSQSGTIKRINCSKCGFENTEDQTYCGRCGGSLTSSSTSSSPYDASNQTVGKVQCPRCGNIPTRNTRFCGRCGAPMEKGDETKLY
jgi:ribosomal protein S27AE